MGTTLIIRAFLINGDHLNYNLYWLFNDTE